MGSSPVHLGIRAKLVALFVLIKVIPLVLLALLAWQGVLYLGQQVDEETRLLSQEMRQAVGDMGDTFSKSAERALNDRAREELERLTTDTARQVAGFLYQRDEDLLLAAALPVNEESFSRFIRHRNRRITDIGEWQLSPEGDQWLPVDPQPRVQADVRSSNPENKQDFHYRSPETVLPDKRIPLYHEITFIDLQGREQIKVQTSDLLPSGLNDITRRENTYARSEDYFRQLQQLQPGEIFVSDVIGPYVPSRIIGPATPAAAAKRNIPFQPEQEAFAGRENPVGKKFKGIIRWGTPVLRNGEKIGYLTLALNHDHLLSFIDHIVPSSERYRMISDASEGTYAFLWDYQDRNIGHPRHHSIVGFDPQTGQRATPWLDEEIYRNWQQSGEPLWDYLKDEPAFEQQSRDKKPSAELTRQGLLGIDCRYVNFAPQCVGWNDLTWQGGSGSFQLYWTGVWKLSTAATIPYFTGRYANSPRGFGYVTIGANIDDFQLPAKETATRMEARLNEFSASLSERQTQLSEQIDQIMQAVAVELSVSTLIMVVIVVVIAVWIASKMTRLVQYFSAGLQKIERGDYSFRFTLKRKDELGRLSCALNGMADSVEASFELSERARQEAEQASQMKSDFLARMSHELRTPLNGILGFAEVIREDGGCPETVEYAGIIHQSGSHLLCLVDDILDLAKMDAGQLMLTPHNIELQPWLTSLVSAHRQEAQRKGLTLSLQAPGLAPSALFYVDDTRLRQVLNNLLSNAIKFSDQGEILLRVSSSASDMVFDVTDQGKGIPEKAHEWVFEAFRQASEHANYCHAGSGLGLCIVRELCHVMGGRVELVNSVPGQGSHFRVILPRQPQPQVADVLAL